MISDYFTYKPEKGEKFNEEKAISVIQKRISDLKDYIKNWLDNNVETDDKWVTAFTMFSHFYINANVFNNMCSKWCQDNRIKIAEYDWKYLTYQVVKSMGFKVSYADGTLGICLDIPTTAFIHTSYKKKYEVSL